MFKRATDCKGDMCTEVCLHVREDSSVYDPEDEYIYKVTYAGEYCVVTATIRLDFDYIYKTAVLRVGAKSLGEFLEVAPKSILGGHEVKGPDTLTEAIHYDWDDVLNAHETALIMLESGMLV